VISPISETSQNLRNIKIEPKIGSHRLASQSQLLCPS